MRWYGVRVIYEHARSPDGHAVFGERVILLQAKSTKELLSKAEAEWTKMVKLNPQFRRLGDFTAFALAKNEKPGNGTEVWCELLESKLKADKFMEQRHARFAIKPEQGGA